MTKKDTTMTVRLSAASVAALDAMRRLEPDMPNRSEMMRRLINRGSFWSPK